MRIGFLVIIFNHRQHVVDGFGIVRIISYTGRYTLVEDVRPRKLQHTCFSIFAVCHHCPVIFSVIPREMVTMRIGKNTASCVSCFVVVAP